MQMMRDPLIHFLALGALVFALHAALTRDRGSEDPRQITVSAGDVEQLVTLWSRQWGRPPTPGELRSLIDDHVREHILHREALALGLDRNDTILRRRLAQKMEFLIADLSHTAEPAEADLRAYHRDHADRYVEPARIGFSHVYFSPDARGERAQMEASATLETLRRLGADGSVDGEYGDSSMLRARYDDASLDIVARDFGKAFAARLAEVAPGQWQGPLVSGFGLHLVYVHGVEAQRRRSFEEALQQVTNDYLFELRRNADEAAYRKLRESYDVVFEDPLPAVPAPE